MIEIDQIVKEVSDETGIDKDTVAAICKHVFSYTVSAMKDGNDVNDILFNKLFKFKLKRRYKEDKTQKYSSR